MWSLYIRIKLEVYTCTLVKTPCRSALCWVDSVGLGWKSHSDRTISHQQWRNISPPQHPMIKPWFDAFCSQTLRDTRDAKLHRISPLTFSLGIFKNCTEKLEARPKVWMHAGHAPTDHCPEDLSETCFLFFLKSNRTQKTENAQQDHHLERQNSDN